MASSCYCVVCAVSLQFKILWRGYTKNKKYWQFHRRVHRQTITRRYFTESWKQFTGLCHNHRRTITRQYFTESWKKFTRLCHNHRRSHQRTLTHRYFTESWKTFTGLCHNHRQSHRQLHRRITHIPKPTHVRHVSVSTSTDEFSDGSKILAGFSIFFCANIN